MVAKELIRLLKRLGCTMVPGKGDHVKVTCGTCKTVVSMQRGDVPIGTFRSIVRDLEPCLGKDWHKK